MRRAQNGAWQAVDGLVWRTQAAAELAERKKQQAEKAKAEAERQEKLAAERAKAEAERREKLAAETDDLLDEIDDVLEENAEDFVRAYVQKGGQ